MRRFFIGFGQDNVLGCALKNSKEDVVRLLIIQESKEEIAQQMMEEEKEEIVRQMMKNSKEEAIRQLLEGIEKEEVLIRLLQPSHSEEKIQSILKK